MNTKTIPTILFLSVLFLSACGTSTQVAQEPVATLPPARDLSGIIAEGHLEPIHYTVLALNASGLVSEVLSQEGDSVAAGDVIARLEATEARTLEGAQAAASQQYTRAYQALRDAQFKLDNFDVPSEIAGLKPSEAVKVTLKKLNQARADFEPYKNLDDRDLEQSERQKRGDEVVTGTARIFKKNLDDAWADYRKAIQWFELESNLETAQALLARAQRDYDSLTDPTFSEDTAGARAALANAEVRAPFPGVIADLTLKVGEFAASGQQVATISDLSSWLVKTADLTEIDVVNIQEGQPVTVKLDALPGLEFNGHVLSISETYTVSQGDVVYDVVILLTDKEAALRWGMTAEVKFE